jgi:hypothetical protein
MVHAVLSAAHPPRSLEGVLRSVRAEDRAPHEGVLRADRGSADDRLPGAAVRGAVPDLAAGPPRDAFGDVLVFRPLLLVHGDELLAVRADPAVGDALPVLAEADVLGGDVVVEDREGLVLERDDVLRGLRSGADQQRREGKNSHRIPPWPAQTM